MRRIALALLVLVPAVAAAAVEVHDRAQLAAALQKGPPCCVVDARSPASRLARPVADALVYRSGMKINPTAAVVVIGDTDASALRAAEDLARTNAAPQVVVVKGGLATWEAVASPGDAAGGASRIFVIPRNTCEQDTPLQTLRSAPPPGAR